MTKHIIKMCENNTGEIFIADFEGDPGRTYRKDYARIYNSEKSANSALNKMKKLYSFRSFDDAVILKHGEDNEKHKR